MIADCESEEDDVFMPRYVILSVSFVHNIVLTISTNLVPQETVLKRPGLKSLLPPRRFQSRLVSLSLMQPCMYML